MLIYAALASLFLQPSVDAASCWASFSRAEFPFCVSATPAYVVHWSVDANASTIRIATDGDGFMKWFGVGWSESGLRGFDMAVAVVGSQAQTWLMGDYFSLDDDPVLDEQQDFVMEVPPVWDQRNRTTAIFMRELDTCDLADVPVPYHMDRTLTWAYGYSDWTAAKANFFNTTHGTVMGVTMWPKPNSTLALPPAATNLTLTMPAYPVPASPDVTVCTNFPLPVDMPYHAVRYEGMANSSLVDRMMVFACAPGVTPLQPTGTVYNCSRTLPVGCETLQFMWGLGATPFAAPPQAGFAFGANSSTYYVLRAHYSNPGRRVLSDSSGFKVTYTSTLRNTTLGVLTLGSYDINVPPAQERFQVSPNTCPASCTGSRVAAPATMVSNFFLMGQRGTAVYTRHIRNGTAMQPLGARNYYDGDYTGFQTVPPTTNVLLPNDTLITICSYDTSMEPKYNTTYGTGVGQEMCFNFITFYPGSSLPGLDICIANTRKNTSSCTTRTRQAAVQAANLTDAQQLRNGTLVPFVPLDVAPWKSAVCRAKEGADITPNTPPNTKGAIASILTVVLVLTSIGLVLYFKYQRKEEMEALLEQIRKEGYS